MTSNPIKQKDGVVLYYAKGLITPYVLANKSKPFDVEFFSNPDHAEEAFNGRIQTKKDAANPAWRYI